MAEDKVGDDDKATGRITKSSVDDMETPPAGSRTILWDADVRGFGVRIASSGIRTYFLRYRMGGRDTPQRMVTIGRPGSPWTTAQARRRAVELLAQVRLGVDPVGVREAAALAAATREAERGERMFATFADTWMEDHVRRNHLRSEDDILGVLERDLKPAFAGKTIDEIRKADVTAMLDAIGRRSQSAANKAHKWLRAIYNWLIKKGHAESSPVDRMARPFKEPSRDRVLSLSELVVVWARRFWLGRTRGDLRRRAGPRK